MRKYDVSEPVRGFTFMLGRKDVFVVTELKNRTQELARKILRKMELPENPNTVQEILYYLQKAELTLCKLPNSGREYWEIHGDNFGGKGSFVDDGNTIIIEL